MLGSSASVSNPNTVLNTAVAEILRQFADELETASNFETALHDLIKRVITQHKRIIFNGNGYDDAWLAEAEKRGLLNLKTTPDAMPYLVKNKNIQLFTTHRVYTEKEMFSRYEIYLESYCNLITIEARTMLDMALKDILPAVSKYSGTLCDTLLAKKAVCKKLDCGYEKDMLQKIADLSAKAYASAQALEKALNEATKIADPDVRAVYYKDHVLQEMQALRLAANGLENVVSAEYWPFPTYGELLFEV